MASSRKARTPSRLRVRAAQQKAHHSSASDTPRYGRPGSRCGNLESGFTCLYETVEGRHDFASSHSCGPARELMIHLFVPRAASNHSPPAPVSQLSASDLLFRGFRSLPRFVSLAERDCRKWRWTPRTCSCFPSNFPLRSCSGRPSSQQSTFGDFIVANSALLNL